MTINGLRAISMAILSEELATGGAYRSAPCACNHQPSRSAYSRMIILGCNIQKFPDLNHPVFKDEPGNRDPQSVHFQADGGARRVQRVQPSTALRWRRRCTRPGYRATCSANVDGVIAALLLKIL